MKLRNEGNPDHGKSIFVTAAYSYTFRTEEKQIVKREIEQGWYNNQLHYNKWQNSAEEVTTYNLLSCTDNPTFIKRNNDNLVNTDLLHSTNTVQLSLRYLNLNWLLLIAVLFLINELNLNLFSNYTMLIYCMYGTESDLNASSFPADYCAYRRREFIWWCIHPHKK